jgi:hypothetical protein
MERKPQRPRRDDKFKIFPARPMGHGGRICNFLA